MNLYLPLDVLSGNKENTVPQLFHGMPNLSQVSATPNLLSENRSLRKSFFWEKRRDLRSPTRRWANGFLGVDFAASCKLSKF